MKNKTIITMIAAAMLALPGLLLAQGYYDQNGNYHAPSAIDGYYDQLGGYHSARTSPFDPNHYDTGMPNGWIAVRDRNTGAVYFIPARR